MFQVVCDKDCTERPGVCGDQQVHRAYGNPRDLQNAADLPIMLRAENCIVVADGECKLSSNQERDAALAGLSR